VAEFSGKVLDPDYQHARQVAGELMAVGKVIQWCLAQQQNRIAIYYDYEGIEHWVTGKWKAKQLLTQRYRDYVQKSGVSIQWVKVTAHTGDYWNEYVDQLAKQAALL
jgi:ribonuclease HI